MRLQGYKAVSFLIKAFNLDLALDVFMDHLKLSFRCVDCRSVIWHSDRINSGCWTLRKIKFNHDECGIILMSGFKDTL